MVLAIVSRQTDSAQGFFIVWAPPRLATEVATEEPASWSSTCVDEGLSTQVDIAAPQRPLDAI
jgi:hypothetical protein